MAKEPLRAYVSLSEHEIEMLEWFLDGLQKGWFTHHPELDPYCEWPTSVVGYQDSMITFSEYHLKDLLERLLSRAHETLITIEIPTLDDSLIQPPKCSKCGATMRLVWPKDSKSNWSVFWGCPNYRSCGGDGISAWFIYALVDPTTDAPFYVGMTRHPRNRLTQHLASGNYRLELEDEQTRKARYISALSLQGKQPVLRVLEYTANKRAASEREDFWIMKLIREGHDLTNKVG